MNFALIGAAGFIPSSRRFRRRWNGYGRVIRRANSRQETPSTRVGMAPVVRSEGGMTNDYDSVAYFGVKAPRSRSALKASGTRPVTA